MRSASSSTCSRRTTCSPNGSPGSCTTSPSMPSPGKAGVSEPRQAADFLREARERERAARSEEHTSELQSQSNLVCRLLLETRAVIFEDDTRFLRDPKELLSGLDAVDFGTTNFSVHLYTAHDPLRTLMLTSTALTLACTELQ